MRRKSIFDRSHLKIGSDGEFNFKCLPATVFVFSRFNVQMSCFALKLARILSLKIPSSVEETVPDSPR